MGTLLAYLLLIASGVGLVVLFLALLQEALAQEPLERPPALVAGGIALFACAAGEGAVRLLGGGGPWLPYLALPPVFALLAALVGWGLRRRRLRSR